MKEISGVEYYVILKSLYSRLPPARWYSMVSFLTGPETKVLSADDWAGPTRGLLPGHLQTLHGHLQHRADTEGQG